MDAPDPVDYLITSVRYWIHDYTKAFLIGKKHPTSFIGFTMSANSLFFNDLIEKSTFFTSQSAEATQDRDDLIKAITKQPADVHKDYNIVLTQLGTNIIEKAKPNPSGFEGVLTLVYSHLINNLNDPKAIVIRKKNKESSGIEEPFQKMWSYGPLGVLPDFMEDAPLFWEKLVAKAEAYYEWIKRVKSNGKWDFKVQSNFQKHKTNNYDPVTNRHYRLDIWGNLHYGFIGKGIGFSDFELYAGGGIAQVLFTQLRELKRGNTQPLWDGYKRYINAALKFDKHFIAGFDDPLDKEIVRIGISLYDQYGSGLKYDTLRKTIRDARDSIATS